VYDAGTQMVRREIDMTSDDTYAGKLKEKLLELHQYAINLQAIPSQEGFPIQIMWPDQPSESI